MSEPLYIHIEYRDSPHTRNLVYADRVEYYEGDFQHDGTVLWRLAATLPTRSGDLEAAWNAGFARGRDDEGPGSFVAWQAKRKAGGDGE